MAVVWTLAPSGKGENIESGDERQATVEITLNCCMSVVEMET